MDRNTIIGLILIGLIVIGFGYMSQPSPEKLAAMKHARDSVAALQKDTASVKVALAEKSQAPLVPVSQAVVSDSSVHGDSTHATLLQNKYGVFAGSAEKENEFAVIENDVMKVKISANGGRVYSVELKKYKTWDSLPLVLFDGADNTFRVQFPTTENKIINTDELFFKADKKNVTLSGTQSGALTMRLKAGEGKYLDYTYTLSGDSYVLGFSIAATGLKDIIAQNSSYLSVDWAIRMPKLEKSITNERMASNCYYKFTDDEVDNIGEGKDDKISLPTKVKWISFKQQFFSAVLISKNEFETPISVETRSDKNSHTVVKDMMAGFSLPYSHKSSEAYDMQFYFGPNHYQTLKKMDINLEKTIPLGWGIFGWVNRFLVIPTFNALASLNLGYGIIILLLTILIKVVLLPFTYRAYLSQAKMRVIKPEVDEITAKYPNDPMKSQQETMSIYRKAGVSPFGGCLPLLFQLPILIAMFRFFPSSIELRQQSFLWAHDLSTYDSIYDFGFNIPFYGDHISLFTILMTVSTILYTMMNQQMMGGGNSAMQKQMKWMGYLMPIVFLGIMNNYSAGLSYYYFLANITGFAQQYLFKFFVDEKAIHAQIQENKKKPNAGKKSGFQQRLEEMAKQKGYKLPK